MDVSKLKRGDKVWIRSPWAGDYNPIQVTVKRVETRPADYGNGRFYYDLPEYGERSCDTAFATEAECVTDSLADLQIRARSATMDAEEFAAKYAHLLP